VQVGEAGEPGDVREAGVGDGGAGEVELHNLGEAFDDRELFVSRVLAREG
jgi:hypothetical protein